MRDCLVVAAGGAMGAVMRYLVGKLPIGDGNGFHVKTFLVNIIGCFIIGLAAAVFAAQFIADSLF